jgi:hypothetical protein
MLKGSVELVGYIYVFPMITKTLFSEIIYLIYPFRFPKGFKLFKPLQFY